MKTIKNCQLGGLLVLVGLFLSRCTFYKWQAMENSTNVESKILKEGTEVYVYLNVSETLWRLENPVMDNNGWSGTVIRQSNKSPKITGTKQERLSVSHLLILCHDQAFISGEKATVHKRDILQIKEYRYDKEMSDNSTIFLSLALGIAMFVAPFIIFGGPYVTPSFSGF